MLSGLNKLWIRFFLVAVYATMYVRDHNRPAFHAALGIDPTEYDYTVFRVTSEITKQVFPLTLDSDAPAFQAIMERMRVLAGGIEAAKRQGGIGGAVKRCRPHRCGRLQLRPPVSPAGAGQRDARDDQAAAGMVAGTMSWAEHGWPLVYAGVLWFVATGAVLALDSR